jgi:hypothetical protein
LRLICNYCDKKWPSARARRAFKTSYKPVLQLADQSIDALLLGAALGKLDRLVDQLVDAPLDECAIETFWHNLPMCVHPPDEKRPLPRDLGTAQAATENEFAGAVAGVAMGLGAICTSLAAPYLIPLLVW